MIDVEMSTDIRKYETKTVGPFTTRQTVCIAIGVVCALPFLLFLHCDWTTRIMIALFAMTPAFLCGWVKLNGTYFEVVAIRFVYKNYLTPQKRKHKVNNVYREMYKKMKKEDEDRMLAALPKGQQKKYLKNKENHLVKYSDKAEFKVYR